MAVTLNQSKTSPVPERSRRVAVVLPHLGLGGAQRVATAMSAYWFDRGHDVTIVTLLDQPSDFYRLHPQVKRITLPNGVLIRARRFIVRKIEGTKASTSIGAPGRGNTAAGGNRKLDRLRAMYRALLRIEARMLGFAARKRLLGRSSRVYTALLRIFYWRGRKLRGVFERITPDVVFSLLGATNIITVAASVDLPHRTIISERNDPSRQRLDPPWEDMRRVLYREADAVSANSRGALAAMRAYCPEEKLHHAPNPLILADDGADSKRSNSVLFLARLVPQKAPDVLIEAFAQFVRTAPGWKLHIAGGGPMAEQLQARVRELGLSRDVTFHGVVTDPSPLLATSRIFVLPSRFEGTPNALLEAMAHRMACIVSDASPGPLRLIEDGTNGLVVETDSAKSLADAMTRLSQEEQLQRTMGSAGLERVREFGIDRVGPIWNRILFADDPSDVAGEQ